MAIQDDMPTARPGTTEFTYEDYVNFPDDGRRHELIDGAHYVTPSPDRHSVGGRRACVVRRHDRLAANQASALRALAR